MVMLHTTQLDCEPLCLSRTDFSHTGTDPGFWSGSRNLTSGPWASLLGVLPSIDKSCFVAKTNTPMKKNNGKKQKQSELGFALLQLSRKQAVFNDGLWSCFFFFRTLPLQVSCCDVFHPVFCLWWQDPPPTLEMWFLGSSGNFKQLSVLKKKEANSPPKNFPTFLHFWMLHAILSAQKIFTQIVFFFCFFFLLASKIFFFYWAVCEARWHNATKHSSFIVAQFMLGSIWSFFFKWVWQLWSCRHDKTEIRKAPAQ